jgi:hypothetical protein
MAGRTAGRVQPVSVSFRLSLYNQFYIRLSSVYNSVTLVHLFFPRFTIHSKLPAVVVLATSSRQVEKESARMHTHEIVVKEGLVNGCSLSSLKLCDPQA